MAHRRGKSWLRLIFGGIVLLILGTLTWLMDFFSEKLEEASEWIKATAWPLGDWMEEFTNEEPKP